MNLEDPTPSTTELADLQTARHDFPRYQIDIDLTIGRRRYIARRTQPGPGPHTLITSDLTELRTELATGHPTPPVPRRSPPRD